MTGQGHKLTGVAAGFFAALFARALDLPEWIAAGAASLSTLLPDLVEIPIHVMGQRVGSIIPHRTITHWPPLWLALAWGGYSLGALPGALMLGAATGALTHILTDAPNPMGIPWLVPNQRLRFGKRGWWRSGEHEFLIVVTLTGLACALWYWLP